MKKFWIVFSLSLLLLSGIQAQKKHSFKIAKLKYGGGGDWYANPSSLENLIKFVRKNTTIQVAKEPDIVEPGGTQLYQYPLIYLTGHGNIDFTEAEAKNIRKYLISGGFLHIDDNYGLDPYIRREMKEVFPELDFVELAFSHEIYKTQYPFEKGLPKIHEHDGKPTQGFGLVYEGRLVCFYSYECDLGDGWEDVNVHNDPNEKRQAAFKMGTNILLFALKN